MKRRLLALILLLPAYQTAAATAPTWATYTVIFDATWSAGTHPTTFPPGAHFSGLIGGTHNAAPVFWAEGEPATVGIRQMAEWGSQSALAAEVEAEIATGNAGEVISGVVLWVSPGQSVTSFSIGPDHPLVTLVTMIASSPDWFAGVAGLNLLVGEQWLTELVVPLYPYDAGTDSGTNYTSPDAPTAPPQAIAPIVGAPFNAGVPVGILTFRLDGAAATPQVPDALSLSAQPNPFNPTTVLHYNLPHGARTVRLAIFDTRGRKVRNLKAATDPGNQTTAWDGRTDHGLGAAAGLYFARLEVDGEVAVQKMVLVQ